MGTLKQTTNFDSQHQAAHDYRDKCLAYGRRHGLSPDGYPSLSKAKYPHQWAEWRAYYSAKGLRASLDLMSSGRNEKTVPTLSPGDFDPTWLLIREQFRSYQP